MGGVAGGALAAAVSAAGGLGMIGIGSAGSLELVERESQLARDAGSRFGIGLLDWAVAREPALLDAALECHARASLGQFWRRVVMGVAGQRCRDRDGDPDFRCGRRSTGRKRRGRGPGGAGGRGRWAR